jgi:hypothetical protein
MLDRLDAIRLAQSRFNADVAHQLLDPVHAILLESDPGGAADAPDSAPAVRQRIATLARRIEALCETLLAYSRSAALDPNRLRPVDLEPVLAAGVDPRQIVIGAPLYTRAWSGVAPGAAGGYLQPATGAAPGTFEAGVYDYKDLLAQVQNPGGGWQLYWDDNAQAAYVYNQSEGLFSSFETPTSIAQRAQWASEMGFGGMMFWDITNDALDSPESLVNAAYASWVLGEDLDTIRAKSSLTSEIMVGGDGVITVLPVTL